MITTASLTVRRMAGTLALAVLTAAGLSACTPSGTLSSNPEYFHYKYKIAQRQANGLFRVPTCAGHTDLPLAQITQWIANDNASLRGCAKSYVVDVKAQRNQNLGLIKVDVHGNPATAQSDVQIKALLAVVQGTHSDPTNIFLEGTGPLNPGMLGGGFSEVYFGSGGQDVFSTRMGANSFFRYELVSLDTASDRVSGNFDFIAGNKNNSSDTRLLIVMDGTYLMDID